MKLSPQVRFTLIYTIALLYILLFTYAAVSKLLEFENFQVQLGQSPLLSPIAEHIAWMVPVAEIAIAILLMISRTRTMALFAAYTLMVMFTAYIYIILNFSSYIPCSCGGILEKLGWTEHLLFNSLFVVLAVLALLLLSNPPQPKTTETKNNPLHQNP